MFTIEATLYFKMIYTSTLVENEYEVIKVIISINRVIETIAIFFYHK